MADKNEPTPLTIDFSTFCVSLGTSALVGLGLEPNPETGQRELDLELARQNIEILAMLKEKSTGNLDEQEESLINTLIYELRMAFVKACNN